jgi:hypothetical protein
MTDGPPLRIGTAEREAAYDALNTHLDAGRLDVEEYAERFAHASVARNRDELDVLFIDLPEPHPFTPRPPSRFAYSARWVARSGSLLVKIAIALVILGAVVVTAGRAFILLPLLGLLTGGRRHLRGSQGRSDLYLRGPGHPGAW